MRTYLTNQDIFNGVWDHFVVNKNPRSNLPNDGPCIYGGTGCAVGCLIDDKELCKKMDSELVSLHAPDICERFPGLVDVFAGLKTLSKESTLSFLSIMQQAHDNIIGYPDKAFSNLMERRLRDIAAALKLTIPGETNATAAVG